VGDKVALKGTLEIHMARHASRHPNQADSSWAVVVVEDNLLLREGLIRIISEGKVRIEAALSSVEELAESSLPRDHPLLLVLGSRDEPANTAKQIRAFKQYYPDARVAVVANSHNTDDIVMAFCSGADGYLAKPISYDNIIKALGLIMSGETLLTSAMLSRLPDWRQERAAADDDLARWPAAHGGVEAPPFSGSNEHDMPPLSARERFILGRILDGNSNKAIARKIGVSESTVKVHVRSIMRKIRVVNRTQAAIWASRHLHWILPDESGLDAVDDPAIGM
jgi:two-component system nitrate/nitrite response regulator NarL